jgi:hypothetical protein
LETPIFKETLKSKLNAGVGTAVDFLYNSYGSMLFGYILQFIPDNKEAGKVLVLVFDKIAARLQEACTSSLSVYCWMQVEARQVILEYQRQLSSNNNGRQPVTQEYNKSAYYLSLLEGASDEQRLVFKEIFLLGREKEDLANQLQKNVHEISRLLKESLVIMRKNIS